MAKRETEGAPVRCDFCGRVHAPTDDDGRLTEAAVKWHLERDKTVVENPHAPGGWTYLFTAPVPTDEELRRQYG